VDAPATFGTVSNRLLRWLRFFLAPKYMTNCSYKHTFSPPHLIYLLTPTSSQHILTSSYHYHIKITNLNQTNQIFTMIYTKLPDSQQYSHNLPQYHTKLPESSAKLPESCRNLIKTTRILAKLHQNYQNLSEISAKLPES